jgi:hypothetical protein
MHHNHYQQEGPKPELHVVLGYLNKTIALSPIVKKVAQSQGRSQEKRLLGLAKQVERNFCQQYLGLMYICVARMARCAYLINNTII